MLVKEVERVSQYEWGYSNFLYLYMEERSTAAVRLYQKLGYRKVWVDKGDVKTPLHRRTKHSSCSAVSKTGLSQSLGGQRRCEDTST
jgi:hypothetical protein